MVKDRSISASTIWAASSRAPSTDLGGQRRKTIRPYNSGPCRTCGQAAAARAMQGPMRYQLDQIGSDLRQIDRPAQGSVRARVIRVRTVSLSSVQRLLRAISAKRLRLLRFPGLQRLPDVLVALPQSSPSQAGRQDFPSAVT